MATRRNAPLPGASREANIPTLWGRPYAGDLMMKKAELKFTSEFVGRCVFVGIYYGNGFVVFEKWEDRK
jgi:hypothetical protein